MYKDVIHIAHYSFIKIVNIIHTNQKTHQQIRNFIEELELEDKHSDVPFYTIVRWLLTSNVFSRFVVLFKSIITFLKENKRSYSQPENDEWMQDLKFLTDIMNYLQPLNMALQRKDKIISDLIFSFKNKIRIFQEICCQETSITVRE